MFLTAGISFFACNCDDLKIVFENLPELAEEFFQVLGNRQIQVGHVDTAYFGGIEFHGGIPLFDFCSGAGVG